MPKYEVQWVKRYYIAGTVEVEADHKEAAHDMVLDRMWDYVKIRLPRHEKGDAQFQYDIDGDEVYVIGEKKLVS